MSDAAFTKFIRKPFTVMAVEITTENIDELAKLVGEVRFKGEEIFIALDKRIVPNVNRAFVGWYLTRLGENLRCYSPKVFVDQFMPMPDSDTVTFTEAELAMEETTSYAEIPVGEYVRREAAGST